MRIALLSAADFRNYERVSIALGEQLTVVTGSNGAGKTNLLEALYFGCTGRSPRTSRERELIRHHAPLCRVEIELVAEDGEHRLEAALPRDGAKLLRVDGRLADGPVTPPARPLVAVFMPERLELVKGGPSARRAHLDQVIAALWPARAGTRALYARALAQRNALIGRIRSGLVRSAALDPWDASLAAHGAEIMSARREAVALLAPRFTAVAEELGLADRATLEYRPRSAATDESGLLAELAARRDEDLHRGFTAHGPHRDDLSLALGGRPARAYASQGQQRAAVLALLLAERALLAERRLAPPLLLLDDVMSELDARLRELLAEALRDEGQVVVTTTDPGQVPGAAAARLVTVEDGVARTALSAAAA
jgi:DNA replication and repair protein RecF